MSFRSLTHYFVYMALAGQYGDAPEHPEPSAWEKNMQRSSDQNKLLRIGEATHRVFQFSRQRVPRHCVDAEITPPRRLGQAQMRITGDLPSPTAVAAGARERDVKIDPAGPQLEHTEASSDSDHRTESSEDRLQRSRIDAVNLQVQIVGRLGADFI